MLRIKNLALVENAWNDGELEKLAGEALVNAVGASAPVVARGHFHMNSCGAGIEAAIHAAGQNIKSITLPKANKLSVELVAHVTRKFVIEAGDLTVDTGMKGLTAAQRNNAQFGNDITPDTGIIPLGSAATETKVVTLDLTVKVATGVAESDAGHKIVITADNAAGFIYFNMLVPAVKCVGREPACHFEIRGVRPWNNLQERRVVEAITEKADDTAAAVALAVEPEP